MVDGSLQYRSDTAPWRTLARPRGIAVRGSPSILGTWSDPTAGTSELTVAIRGSDGNLWLEDLELTPDLTVRHVNLPWTRYGRPSAALVGNPALVVIDTAGFFEPTVFEAAKDGAVWSHTSNTGARWVRTSMRAQEVGGSVSPDWTHAVLVLTRHTSRGQRLNWEP